MVNKANIKTYSRLIKFLLPYKGRFFLMLFAMAIYGSTDGIIPYILKSILDDVFRDQSKDKLYLLMIVIIGFSFVRAFFGFLQQFLNGYIGNHIIGDVRNRLAKKILEISGSLNENDSSGLLISRITNDALLIRSALTDAAGTLIKDSIRIITLVGMVLYLDFKLGLIALIGFPLALIPIFKFSKRVKKHGKVGQDQIGRLAVTLQEMILGEKVIKAFRLENKQEERFNQENETLFNNMIKAEKYGALAGPTNEIIASLAIAGVIFYGGNSVISGVKSPGEFVGFITSVFLLYDPFKKIGRLSNIVAYGTSAAERIFEILDSSSQVQNSANPININSQKTSDPVLEFDHVTFEYKTNSPVLKNINLKINQGQTIALVGMSGGGKSTLVNLIPRFADPQMGVIKYSGVDIKQIDLDSLRDQFALVTQTNFLFNDTIYNNILYGKLNATREEVVRAAERAYADKFINNLPNGYNTITGEQGFSLSGGERARIALARAFLKDAPILILDEATAALDSESEKFIQQALDDIMQEKTVIVIAHRLSTIRNADKIVVISNGSIVESGNFEDLIQKQGEFFKLHQLQFSN